MDPIKPYPAAATSPSLHHALLVASAAVTQASTRTAMLASRMGRNRATSAGSPIALVGVFAGGDSDAAALLDGSFHPRIASAMARAGQTAFVKDALTFAF